MQLTEVICMFQSWPPGIECQLCGMMYSDLSEITAHYDMVHAQKFSRPEHPDAKHECEVCGRKFVRKQHLKRHMATVHVDGDVKTF